jgi:hypothetical protein
VGFGDVLFGRKKLQDAAEERLFAISTAQVTLETEFGLIPSGAAGVCFKALSSSEFARAERELTELLSGPDKGGPKVERREDAFGYRWLVVRDPAFENLVAGIHLIATEFESSGFGAQLLAAAFRFGGGARTVYWIYGFKRGTFWPFVPTGNGEERDNATELRLSAQLGKELPVEEDLSRWFGLFGAPLEPDPSTSVSGTKCAETPHGETDREG